MKPYKKLEVGDKVRVIGLRREPGASTVNPLNNKEGVVTDVADAWGNDITLTVELPGYGTSFFRERSLELITEETESPKVKVGDIDPSTGGITFSKEYVQKVGMEFLKRFNEGEENYKMNLSQGDIAPAPTHDRVNHPAHYTSHPSGVEVITITRWHSFGIGNALKYLLRAGLKEESNLDPLEKQIEDLEKARWYIADEIARLKGEYDK